MPASHRFIVAFSFALLVSACVSPVEVAVQQRGVFSPDFDRRTWNWGPYVDVETEDERTQWSTLDRSFTRALTIALAERGFVQSEESPDFLLAYRTSDTERIVKVEVPLAADLVRSHGSSASFLVGGTDVEERVYQDVELSIYVTEGPGESFWHASIIVPLEEGQQVPLEESLARLLERLPFPDPPSPH